MKWTYVFGLIHAIHTAEQLQEIKSRSRKEGDTRVHCYTRPHKKHALSPRGQSVWWRNTWLGRGPNLLKPQSCCICTETTWQKRTTPLAHTVLHLQWRSWHRSTCLGCEHWGVGEWIGERHRETERGACRLTVCQTTRSAHPRRGVGFLTEYSYLKPRSLLCGCKRDWRDGDSFATYVVQTQWVCNWVFHRFVCVRACLEMDEIQISGRK